MQLSSRLVWLPLVVLLACATAAAQPGNEQATSTDTAAAPDEPADTAADATADDDSAAEAAQRRRDSPFDYEASEEISEDLSVSFPVDI